MYRKFSKLIFILVSVSLVFLLTWCAENEPLAPDPAAESIETNIVAGPAEGAQLAFNSTVTFTWDGSISPGTISAFSYMLTMGTDTMYINTSGQKSFSQSNMQTGNYTFSVYAMGTHDEEIFVDASPATRNFTVGAADALAPVVTFVQSPKVNSYASTGSNMFFEWTATDPSTGGGIVSYEFALEDQSVAVGDVSWSTPTLLTSQKSYFNLANGDMRFWVRATDVSGATGTASSDFVIKDPDVLFVIGGAMTAADVTFWHDNALRDFAYEDFYTSDAASLIAKLNSGQYSSVVWALKNDYASVTDAAEYTDVYATGTIAEAFYNFEQGGGHIWVVSSEVMWMFDDIGTPIAGDSTFATNVLHAASYNENSHNFQGATSTGVGSYQVVVVDGNATFDWVDQVDPTADAEAIYGFTPTQVAIDAGFGNGEPCGIRYPAGAANPGDTKVVFLGFYLTDSSQPAACKAGDIYNLATTVFTDFGENND